MKRAILALSLTAATLSASAATWWVNGVLYGNICRNGIYYTVYPLHMGQPVGSMCPLRDNYGNIVMWGRVSNE